MGLRNTRLAAELGRPDLFVEARRAATSARRFGLASIIDAIGRVHRVTAENRLPALVEFAQILPRHKDQIEPWLLVELGAKFKPWMEELESALFNGHNAAVLIKLLPPFYEALDVPDRTARTERLQQRAIQLLIKDKQFTPALAALRASPERQPELEAVCHEGMGDFRSAAECHLMVGNLKEALNCYRSIPDMEAALKLVSRDWRASCRRVPAVDLQTATVSGGAAGEVHEGCDDGGKEAPSGIVGARAGRQPA